MYLYFYTIFETEGVVRVYIATKDVKPQETHTSFENKRIKKIFFTWKVVDVVFELQWRF